MASSSQPLLAGDRVQSGSERPGLWQRVLLPSFSDLLFISLIVWMFAAGRDGWLGLLVDGDTGWHIRTGEYILDHGSVPRVDLFSFSKAAEPWFAWEWLSDVVFALLFRAAHFKGVVLLAGTAIALTGLLVFRRMIWRAVNPFVALVFTLLGVGCSCVHYLARPHILTLLLLATAVWMIEADRRRPSWRIWLLIPLMVLWTNLHGGFMALVACLALLLAGTAVEAWLSGAADNRWRGLMRYSCLTAACGLATLANPYGWQLHAHVVKYLRSDWIRKVVEEFQSPMFRNESMFQFEVLMIAGLVSAGWMIRRKRIVEALWVVFWIHASLGSVRHVPVFVIVASPLIASEVSAWWSGWTAGRSKKSLAGIFDALARDLTGAFRRTSVWAPAAVLALTFLNQPIKWPGDFPDVKFPVKAVDRYPDLLASRRVLTADQWADYLIYRFYPRVRVFFDGRSDFYGQAMGERYIGLAQARWDWEKTMEHYGFEVALTPAQWPLASVLKRHPGWRLVYDDGLAVLFIRTGVPEKIGAAELMKSQPAAERHRGDHHG